MSCNPKYWQEVLIAANKKPDRVMLMRAALSDVIDCHQIKGGKNPDLDAQALRKMVWVDRRKLFAFMVEHGKVCK